LLAGGLTISIYALSAEVPTNAKELYLYRGETVASQNITLGGWGSGYAEQSQKEYYDPTGKNSIMLLTDGYYAGGRIDFSQPIDIGEVLNDHDGYLVFTVRFPGLSEDEDFSEGPSSLGPGRAPGVPPGVPPGGAGPSGTDEGTGPKIGFFRAVIVVNGLQLVAEDQPVDIRRTQSGWTTLSVPFAAFKGPRPTVGRAMLSRIIFSGDRPDTFYIGEITTRIDDSDIALDVPPEEQTISPGDTLQLTATADPGLANVEMVWDFDKRDGLQEEAFGETVVHSWKDPGEYTVTLRVRDINGVKPELREEFVMTVAL
jgi:hypothetical protein